MRLRVKAAQEFDRCITSLNTAPKCHKRTSGSDAGTSGISYQSARIIWLIVPPTPLELQQLRKLVDKLLERELQVKKQPVRRKEPEEVKKEPVEQE